MQPQGQQPISDVPLKIVGSNVFGRNPKINAEKTYNMFISDIALVQTSGYKKVIDFPMNSIGRAIYSSERGGFMITVINNTVYKITGPSNNLSASPIFNLDTFEGDVFIDENLNNEIAICDQKDLWIYDWVTGDEDKAPLPTSERTGLVINPGYVTYHDTYFIVPDIDTGDWYLSASNNGNSWEWINSRPVTASIQTKPDNCVAVLRAPGRGNLIYVFGKNVTEMWYDNAGQLFPYQRSTSVSIDYGCLSATTIATMDNYVCWLGVNEKSGPVIMTSSGTNFERLSNDGIDFKLATVKFPQDSYAFFYKSDGHTFYQITFFNSADNFTLIHDFDTKKFFYLTDENMNYHIAESVAFFNNTYYFVSINDGSIYELNSDFTTYDYTLPSFHNPNPNPEIVYQVPRVRICNNIRQNDSSPMIANSLTFTLEQGVDPNYIGTYITLLTTEDGRVLTTEANPGYLGEFLTTEDSVDEYTPRVDMTLSIDGGLNFGNGTSTIMNPLGQTQNKVTFWKMGRGNDFVFQFRFWSDYRITAFDGVVQMKTMSGPR